MNEFGYQVSVQNFFISAIFSNKVKHSIDQALSEFHGHLGLQTFQANLPEGVGSVLIGGEDILNGTLLS
jgi:hypothetical protein